MSPPRRRKFSFVLRMAGVLLALSGLVVLPACWVFSVNPLYEEDVAKPDPDLTFAPVLVGSWGRVDDDCLWILTITANGQVYELTLGPSPQCKGDQETTRYEGHLVKLGTHLVLDLSPRHEEVCYSCMPLQSFLLVQADKDSFTLTPIDDEWLKKSIEQKRVALSVLPGNSDVLTSSTSDLKAFVRKYADDKDAFKPDSDLVFHRR